MTKRAPLQGRLLTTGEAMNALPVQSSRRRHGPFRRTRGKRIDQRLKMSALCAEIGVPERTLRMCCAEFLGVSPTRYLLLQRLNEARAALRSADPSTSSVAQVARNHQF